jgi:hypothetical protein
LFPSRSVCSWRRLTAADAVGIASAEIPTTIVNKSQRLIAHLLDAVANSTAAAPKSARHVSIHGLPNQHANLGARHAKRNPVFPYVWDPWSRSRERVEILRDETRSSLRESVSLHAPARPDRKQRPKGIGQNPNNESRAATLAATTSSGTRFCAGSLPSLTISMTTHSVDLRRKMALVSS